MEKHFARTAYTLAAGAIGTVVVVAFVPMFFAHPLADDLAIWRQSASDGWLAMARFCYLNWTGRWASMALGAGVLPHLAGHRYGVALAVLAAVQLLACFALQRLVLGRSISLPAAAGLAVGLFALHWSSMPAAGETVYWFTGGIHYQLSLSLATLLIWLAACTRPAAPLLRWGLIAGLSLLTLLVTGMHELVALMLVMILALAAVISFRIRSEKLPLWCWLLAIAVLGLFVTGLAPGNAARGTQFANAHDPFKTAAHTLKFFLRDVPTWIADPKLLCASLFLFLSPWFARLRPDWLSWPGISWNKIVPAAGLAFVALGVAAPAFATACSPPGRLENLLHFVFLVTWFVTLLLGTRWPENWILRRESPVRFLQMAALASLGLALLTTGNTSLALRDFDKRIGRWHAAMLAREQLAESAAAGSHLVLPEQPPLPALFFDNDLGQDPGDWRNQLFAQFYGLASVRLETQLDRQAAKNGNVPLR